MISLNTHNVLDYVIGAVLVLCPYVFGFQDIPAARNLFLVLGFGLIGYSLLTRYKYSMLNLIPLGVHMAFDALAGLVLMAGPWLFGYRGLISPAQTVLHFVLGVGAIGLVALTSVRTDATRILTHATRQDRDIDAAEDRAA